MSEFPHPVELSDRIIDSGIAEPPHNRVVEQLTQVEHDVAVVESFSHSWALRTDDGLVCIDASGIGQGIEFTPEGDKLFVGSAAASRIEVYDVYGEYELRKNQKFLKTGRNRHAVVFLSLIHI